MYMLLVQAFAFRDFCIISFFGRPYVAKLAGSALLDMMGSHKVHNIDMGDTRIHEICADVLESII